jgi:D-arabinose 1-dehydrogenase-like Zn-dependent alcohol dehydrogenase
VGDDIYVRSVNGPDLRLVPRHPDPPGRPHPGRRGHDVLIEIKYSGICHSDILNARSDWGPSTYPLVPGHEIAGIVAQVGCMVDSRRECANCLKGEEQYCLKGNTLTYGSVDKDGTLTQGGYAARCPGWGRRR